MFGKSIFDLSFDDIVRFCEAGHSEGLTLDYKLADSKSIAKVACAFANTFGGVILVGVEESNEKPKAPFDGIPNIENIKNSVVDTILSSIYPSVIPRVHVAANATTDKGFLIVEIDRSISSPHAYENNRIYRRFADRNNPNKKKTQLSELEWIETLFRNRVETESYLSDQKTAFDEIHKSVYEFNSKQTLNPKSRVLCRAAILPLCPLPNRINVQSLVRVIDAKRKDTADPHENFFLNNQVYFKTLQDGVYGAFLLGDGDQNELRDPFRIFALLKDNGFIGVAFSAFRSEFDIYGDRKLVDVCLISKITNFFQDFIRLCEVVYSEINLICSIEFSLEVRNCRGTTGIFPPEVENLQNWFFRNTPTGYRMPEDNIGFGLRTLSSEGFGSIDDLVKELSIRLANAYNVNVPPKRQ